MFSISPKAADVRAALQLAVQEWKQMKEWTQLVVIGGAVAAVGSCLLLRRRWLRKQDELLEPPSPAPHSVNAAFHKLMRGRTQVGIERPEGERMLAADRQRVVQVVLTGGPMGGKATLCGRLQSTLSARGWQVVVAPSCLSIMGNSGCTIPGAGDSRALLQFESAVLELQYALEGSFRRAAQCLSGDRCVIIYDRGILDPAAFIPREQWSALAELGPRSEPRPMDWYACVVHLVTAADGAAAVFDQITTKNLLKEQHAASQKLASQKPAKVAAETAEVLLASARSEAMRIDAAISEVQSSHPAYVRVDNSTGFEGKLQRAVAQVLERVEAAAPAR